MGGKEVGGNETGFLSCVPVLLKTPSAFLKKKLFLPEVYAYPPGGDVNLVKVWVRQAAAGHRNLQLPVPRALTKELTKTSI
jgi:hypothetical protein